MEDQLIKKEKIQTDVIQLFPKKDKGDEWKNKDHKWCILITKKEIADQLKLYLEEISKKRIILIDGNKEFEKFKGHERSIINKISSAQIDNCNLEMNSIKYKNGSEVFFIYTGMGFEEVDKYYEEFLNRLRKLRGDKK